MSGGGWMMALVLAMTVATLVFILFSMVRSIRDERSGQLSVWREFGLSISLMILFFVTWIAQAISEWQTYTDEQLEHQQPVEAGDFVAQFMQSTLENWQSEFLQLFSFVTLAALYVHKGSAESKDGTEKLEAALRRIEEKMGTLPQDAPQGEDDWKLAEAPPLKP